MNDQLPLPLPSGRDPQNHPFWESACNAQALAMLRGAWPSGALALVGPPGSGKSHLAALWAREQGAAAFAPGVSAAAVVVENADQWRDPEALFHLLNQAQAGERRVLLTSRKRPADWQSPLPDLRSRLNALPVAELHEPDDALLTQVLLALFESRFIVPADDLIPYLLRRMERSFAAAQEVVERLHRAGLAKGRDVNRALAVRELEVANVINDLFDDQR